MTNAAGHAAVPVLRDGGGDDRAPLTRAEADALRARLPMVSPWRVVAVQAAAGGVCAAAASTIGGPDSGLSALYGTVAVVLPQGVLARGLARSTRGDPAAAAFGFVVWELAKIGLAVALLVAAPKAVAHLSWTALLVAMVVCMKASWLALLRQRRPATNRTTNTTRG